MERNILKDFFEYMKGKRYPIDAYFLFVHNDYNTYSDDPHLEECFDIEETHEILDSVSDIFSTVSAIGSEKDFLEWIYIHENINKNVYVYTMAQNVNGFGRRTLIPALCQYCGFYNLNADAYMSAIGCNKETMFKLLIANNYGSLLAPTIFINSSQLINTRDIYSKLGDQIVLKPICESCCIDVLVLKNYTEKELILSATQLIEKYGHLMIQKYILGSEIGITIFCHNNRMHALTPIEIQFSNGKNHLTHADSYYENFKLVPCEIPSEILSACENMSYLLNFYCTTRYDFRYNGTGFFLFDLSPNPTINGYTSSNLAAQCSLKCDHRGILRLMAYEKIASLEPSFD